jgi:hypothetical protein
LENVIAAILPRAALQALAIKRIILYDSEIREKDNTE